MNWCHLLIFYYFKFHITFFFFLYLFLYFVLFIRSEEHTSELQSRLHLVCRLLLEKKKHDTNIRLPSGRAAGSSARAARLRTVPGTTYQRHRPLLVCSMTHAQQLWSSTPRASSPSP